MDHAIDAHYASRCLVEDQVLPLDNEAKPEAGESSIPWSRARLREARQAFHPIEQGLDELVGAQRRLPAKVDLDLLEVALRSA